MKDRFLKTTAAQGGGVVARWGRLREESQAKNQGKSNKKARRRSELVPVSTRKSSATQKKERADHPQGGEWDEWRIIKREGG